jgi:hypothetical protein
MANYTAQMQKIWRDYEKAGMPMPPTAKQVAIWAINEGKWQSRPADIVSQCAEDLRRAAREEYRTDDRGRRYRAKHSMRVMEGGAQINIWADIDTAPRKYMEKAFAQRRQQIVGDCHQLRLDVDHYNGTHESDDPIQLILDFTDDVEEIFEIELGESKAA